MGKPLHIATVAEHRAFRRMFSKNRMTIGVFFPIEAFEGDVPAMSGQERLAQQAEKLGFSALWTRDVPLRDPTFGDVGDKSMMRGFGSAGSRRRHR